MSSENISHGLNIGDVSGGNYLKIAENGSVTAVGTAQFGTGGGALTTSSAAELNILDGATLSAAELNTLDGITSSAAELNILDGAVVSAAELSQLAGASFTASDLNKLAAVTSTATDLNVLAAALANVTLVATPASGTVGVQFTFKSALGNPTGTPSAGLMYFSSTANGLTRVAVTSIAALTNGSVEGVVATKIYHYITTSGGLLGITITTGAGDYYPVFVMPNGSLEIGSVCTVNA